MLNKAFFFGVEDFRLCARSPFSFPYFKQCREEDELLYSLHSSTHERVIE
jgi:hypothetical protein